MICPFCESENIEGSDECSNCGQALYGLDLPDGPNDRKAPAFIRQPISGLPKREVARVGPNDPVGLAVRQMQRQDVNFVLVMEGEKLVGLITGWDILHKVAGPGEDLNAVTCGGVMTPSPMVLRDEDTIAVAINVMAANGWRHVPIVNDQGPTGVVVVGDVFRHISPHLV